MNGDYPHRTDGALATKARPAAPPVVVVTEPPPALQRRAPVQASLFADRPSGKVVAIEHYVEVQPLPPSRRRAPRTDTGAKARRAAAAPEGQGKLELLPSAADQKRILGTTVEAKITCDWPVATALHRFVAAILDWAMILLAYGAFLGLFHLLGGRIFLTKANLLVFAGTLLLTALTYSLFWTIAGTETAGMHWTQLRLVTLDGYPPDWKQRAARSAASAVSICTAIGLLWSLADEESLAWQDHISATFPTPRILDTGTLHRR